MLFRSPNNALENKSFLGLARYYRHLVEGFSKIAAPLTYLTRKEAKFKWKDKHEPTFQELKEKLTSALVLAIPRSGERFVIYNDASY